MTAFDGVKACVFDAYGTLFDVHSAAAAEAATLGERMTSLSQTWRQKQLEYTWLRSLMGAHADFRQVTRDALDFALQAQEIDEPGLAERLMQLYLRLDAYPDVRPTLERLRAGGLKTAILSNGEPTMLAAAVEHAGLADLLDAALSVEEVGIYKPDARVYQLAIDRFGLAGPAEIAFVSTNGWDARGAANFGFQVAWMNRFGLQLDRLPGEPKAIMTGLEELPGLLGL
ncbi:haloacid dehalogenase type II [Algihabitans albus]|uniref:haloacid dehalogenase type II n=1 Tax=Algihabitans albus TaxID=2164067 RepID=UPI000E5D5A7C|nr:haloacid dehalogenase type II [Algihabitans albus]